MIRTGVALSSIVSTFTLALSGASCIGVANATATPMLAPLVTVHVVAVPPPCAAAFLAAINTPTPETIAAFEDVFASTARKGRATNEDRLVRMKGLHAEFGPFAFRQTLATEERAIVVLTETERRGNVELTFELSAGESGKVDAIAIAAGAAADRQPLDAAARNQIIDDALAALESGYVFPEVAKAMAAAVNVNREAGNYDALVDDAALARRLTRDLQAVSHDRHLNVRVAPPRPEGSQPMDRSVAEMRRENYAFKKVERLDGNIGYVRFDMFFDTDEAKAKAAAAMQFVADCDAVIFDMRYNGGGSPEMIQYITSYLFDSRTHLNDMIDRDSRTVEEYWTLDDVPGKRVATSARIFVLTSGHTFSGAEEFSYNLKNLGRAKIVGETTGGGAHPVRAERLSDRVVITVPFMRANNPITKTNWEGTGVEPDVKCSAAEALDRAIELARSQ